MAKKAAGDLAARLVLETSPFEEGADKAKKITGGLEKDIDGKVDKISESLKKIGLGLSASVTLPLTLFAKQSLETFTNFEQSMQNTFSVMGASASEMEALRQKAEEMGASTRFSASQAADALYSLGSAGQNAAQAAKSLDGVLKLAGATGSDLAFTSETITSTLSQFNLQADKAAHIADVYSMAISKSQANMTKLSYSMKYVGPVASGLNVSLETATAALMRLYNTGFGGEQAGTILRSGLQKLASGTEDLKNKLEKLGISYDDVNPKTNDLADIMDRLKDANIGVTEANDLFGEAAAAGMQKLIESGGEAIRTMGGLLQASDGAAEKMQEIQNASFANTKAELNSAWEAVQITLTSNIIPAVDTFAKGITAVLKAVNDMPVGLQITLQGFMGIAASAGPLLLVAANVTKIKKTWATLNAVMAANPILIWGAAIAAAGAVAMGIIAQVRKAREDELNRASRSLEQVNKMRGEALTQKTDMGKAKDLLKEYEELRSATSLTADQQARYNTVIKELERIIPNAVIVLDENGKAMLKNKSAIEQAIAAGEKYSASLLTASRNLALTEALAAKENIQNLKATAEVQGKDLEQKAAKLGAVYSLYSKLFEIENKVKQQDNVIISTQITAVNEALRAANISEIGIFKIENIRDFTSLMAEISNVKAEITRTTLEAKSALEKTQKTIETLTAAEKELLEVAKQAEEVKTAGSTTFKKSDDDIKKEKLAELKAAWKEYLTGKIQMEAAEARANGEAFNEDKAKFEFLQNNIKQLIAMTGDSGLPLFDIHKGDLEDWINLMWTVRNNMENKGGSGDSEKDNSYQAQIAELDKYWQDRISKAKEYGQDENEVIKQYHEKRLEFIENAIKQEKETGKKTETKKGSGVTLGDELKKTALMGLDGFGKYILQQQELRKELKNTQEEIIATQNKIAQTKAQIEAAEKEGKSGAETEALNQELQAAQAYAGQLEEKAQSLRVDINEAEFSLSQIKNGLGEIEKIGKSDLQIQLINIEEEKNRLLKIIEESKNTKLQAAKDNKEEIIKIEKEAQEQTDKVIADAAKKEKAAIAAAFNEYMQHGISIANSLTDVIANAIEQGGVDGFAAIKASTDILDQIGSMIPEPITQAVFKGISAAVGIATKIVGALNKKVEKEVEEKNRKADEAERERLNKVAEISGGILQDIAKKAFDINNKAISWENILQTANLSREKNKIDKFFKDMDNYETSLTDTKERKRTVTIGSQKPEWQRQLEGMFTFGMSALFDMREIKETYYEEVPVKLVEVYDRMAKARIDGDMETVKKLQAVIDETIRKEAEKQNINLADLNGIKNYVQGMDNALASYIKTGDMKAFKKAMKDALYEAVVQKAVFNSMLAKVQEDLNLVEQGKMSMETFEKNLETMGEDARKYAEELANIFGVKAPIEEIKSEWEKIGEAMSSALSSALADSAYNADWGAFKKSFAGEMKKAVIQSAVESAGLKKKVDAIIKAVMEDGKITTDEITGAVKELQPLYDEMEKMLSEFANITKGLEGGSIEVKSQTSGHIIQQLSGADRDVLLEAIKNGFKTINQSIDLKDATIQHLAATQVIINAVTFNSYNGTVYIQANENTNLTALVTEVVERVMAG